MFHVITSRLAPRPLQEMPKVKEILTDFLNCRFSEVPISILAPVPPYHKWFTVDDRHHHLGSFKACILNKTDDRPCRPLLTRACRNASIVAFKTIRMTLRMTEDILDKNPDLNILHLVRDPRGAMWSNFNAFLRGQNSWENTVAAFKKTTDEHCQNLTDNIKTRLELEGRFPGRIIDIRYEDTVKNPLREAVNLYQFLRQPMPEVLKEWVINSTTARYDNGWYGTSRSRPIHTAYQWIHTMDRWALEIVEKACSHGMQHFRYIPFANLTVKYDELLSQLE
ncbi:carbohydrate sulfotransferase 3 [Lingula anatina]|uniref:Carbohydrate sulfotransferase 3 n=1 Tax=Lingula anatina TaxID=7574 RepID=A0A1S3GZK8_LINAN|nr:carbohydrate sulfotransferase 3 [Lingula anatina]|eukprot:XP_013379310.1 carbohydrate sulfotransferase 3 [Lingula anatina]